MLLTSEKRESRTCERLRTEWPVRALLALCLLIAAPGAAVAYELAQASDFESLYDPGVPPSVSVEWSFPTGFSLGIESGYKLRFSDETAESSEARSINTFPLSFSMKYNLYESQLLSQSVGVGLGPYFLHEGEMPIQLEDVDVTGSSTCNTEWISRLSRDVYLNVKMVYTHAFQTVVDEIPLWDFTTWLGLNLKW